MNNKQIYHYTTIETLALILKNHTIRFSRLDKVDDIEESELMSGPTRVRLGNYIFASCWTRCEEESIAQWKIYAGYDGVRITMSEDDIFQTYDITPEFPNSMQSYFKPPYSPVGKDAIGATEMSDGELRALLEQRKVVQARVYHKDNHWHCFYFTFKGLAGLESGVMGSKPHYHYLSDKSGIAWDELIQRIKDCDMPTSKVHIIIER